MSFKTADISDALHPNVQYVAPLFSSYGGKAKMAGEIVTIKCFEDNSLVKQIVEEDGTGKVMVVDAGGSQRCAMLGDMLAEKAVAHHWEGILMYGLIRDSVDISTMDIGVWALGTLPLKSIKLGAGQRDLAVHFAGVAFTPGAYLYADHDGIIVTKEHP